MSLYYFEDGLHMFYLLNLHKNEIYKKTIEYMMMNSDGFELTFIYKTGENKLAGRANQIRRLLSCFEEYSEEAKNVPDGGVKPLNDPRKYEIVQYRANIAALDSLLLAGNLCKFEIHDNPTDLVFFKNDFGWFNALKELKQTRLFTVRQKVVTDLKSFGVTMTEG